jgi:hypothetical protein
MSTLRKLLAIALLALLGQPFVQPLLARNATNEANLPACCRGNGKHHCMMSMAERRQLASRDTQFKAPSERCPYRQATAVPPLHGRSLLPPAGQAIFAGLSSHPAVAVQTESKLRISRNGARQKRGPPNTFFLQIPSQS